jgi:hypothetical protein
LYLGHTQYRKRKLKIQKKKKKKKKEEEEEEKSSWQTHLRRTYLLIHPFVSLIISHLPCHFLWELEEDVEPNHIPFRERESERERALLMSFPFCPLHEVEGVRERERERESECVCVWERETPALELLWEAREPSLEVRVENTVELVG